MLYFLLPNYLSSISTIIPLSLETPLNQPFRAETGPITNAVVNEAEITLNEDVRETFPQVAVHKY